MSETPDGAYLVGGPRDGAHIAIPGLLQAVCFPVLPPDDYWAGIMARPVDPISCDHMKTDVYNLRGIVKLYEYGGRL